MLEFKKTSPGPFGQVGATVRGVRQFLGRKMELPYEITEYEPGNRLGMKGTMGPITFKDGYVLDPMGNSTRVKFWLELTLTGLMKLAAVRILSCKARHMLTRHLPIKKGIGKSGVIVMGRMPVRGYAYGH